MQRRVSVSSLIVVMDVDGFLNDLRFSVERKANDTYGMEPRAEFELEVEKPLNSDNQTLYDKLHLERCTRKLILKFWWGGIFKPHHSRSRKR